MKSNFFCWILVLLLISMLNIGLVRKKDNPVLATQTDGILYQQKKEEEKDGVKGPSMPEWRVYSKSQFLEELPVNNEEEVAEDALRDDDMFDFGTGLSEDFWEMDDAGDQDYWWLEEDDEFEDPSFKENGSLDDGTNW